MTHINLLTQSNYCNTYLDASLRPMEGHPASESMLLYAEAFAGSIVVPQGLFPIMKPGHAHGGGAADVPCKYTRVSARPTTVDKRSIAVSGHSDKS